MRYLVSMNIRSLYTHLRFRVKVIVVGFGMRILAILQVFLERTFPPNRVRIDFFLTSLSQKVNI